MKALLMVWLFAGAALAGPPSFRGYPAAAGLERHKLEEEARAIPDPLRIREYIRRMSAAPHHAGSPGSRAVAEYALGLFREFGLEARIEEFEALLPTPLRRSVELIEPKYQRAAMREPVLAEDRSSGEEGQLDTFNSYSADGDVTAPVVYVNYGIPADYAELARMRVDVKGRIVLARYGASWRGTKAKVAAEHGAVGLLIYSDPREDGYFAGDVYPKGPFRPKDGVQRGSVMDMPLYPGDPLSPGWASEKGSKRLAREEAPTIMKIPVAPISYADALPVLEALEGPVAPERWRGALPVTYHVGPGPAKVRLRVEHDWRIRPVYNVVARIPGAEWPDQWILYGNHHDAWVNGAADPCSGAAALLETARTAGSLLRRGWKPKRTLIFALWDAEEYGLIGSTEWAEKYASELDRKAVVYFNTDMNTKGSLGVGGSPVLEAFLTEVLRDVRAPGKEKSLLEVAEAQRGKQETGPAFRVAPAGSGSDYTVFLHHLGVSSLNLAFGDGDTAGIYHSIYDSFDWFERFGDPDYLHGRAMAQLMATSLLRVADAPLLPFEFPRLAHAIQEQMTDLDKLPGADKVDLAAAKRELDLLAREAKVCEQRYQQAAGRLAAASANALNKANEALMRTERSFLRAQGLPGRAWMKNHLYAPGAYTGYSAKTLPGVREAVEAQRWDEANRSAAVLAEVFRAIRRQIHEAGQALARI